MLFARRDSCWIVQPTQPCAPNQPYQPGARALLADPKCKSLDLKGTGKRTVAAASSYCDIGTDAVDIIVSLASTISAEELPLAPPPTGKKRCGVRASSASWPGRRAGYAPLAIGHV